MQRLKLQSMTNKEHTHLVIKLPNINHLNSTVSSLNGNNFDTLGAHFHPKWILGSLLDAYIYEIVQNIDPYDSFGNTIENLQIGINAKSIEPDSIGTDVLNCFMARYKVFKNYIYMNYPALNAHLYGTMNLPTIKKQGDSGNYTAIISIGDFYGHGR